MFYLDKEPLPSCLALWIKQGTPEGVSQSDYIHMGYVCMTSIHPSSNKTQSQNHLGSLPSKSSLLLEKSEENSIPDASFVS